ncbi:Zinc finger BED domain-containing protein RICESLEEPER 2 [Glycine max]|nr:Zinc finger BED domain-containing protein RICESLEEPER 2 [Glycine max]
MVYEFPFSIVEDEENNRLKASLKTVNKISLTTDIWKSSHQVVEYMIVTETIFKCLEAWGIEEKVFSVSVDNTSYNNSCFKNLKENLSLGTKLVLNGDLFHVKCCAHILNLLVQDRLGKIQDIIQNVPESVKYINHNDARLKAFSDVEQKRLKERKLILDCPTRSLEGQANPRCKFRVIGIFFPLLYKLEEIAKENVEKVRSILQQLYDEYVALRNEESSSNERNVGGINSSTIHVPDTFSMTRFDQLMSLVHEKEAVPPMKSELDAYLEEKNTYISNNENSTFSALEWWRNNSFKYKDFIKDGKRYTSCSNVNRCIRIYI